MQIDDLQKVYDDIALNILNTVQIEREGELFDLVEIEVYLFDEKKVEDIFIHRNKQQLNTEGIYYHYSGIDICRGNGIDMYCGVLVRGISNEKETIYGPGKIAYNHKDSKSERNIKEKNKKEDQCVFSDEAKEGENIQNIVLKLPRVNLGHSTIVNNNTKEDDYTDRVYKYLNLKARYLRLINGEIRSSKNKSPAEIREVFTAFYKYKNQDI